MGELVVGVGAAGLVATSPSVSVTTCRAVGGGASGEPMRGEERASGDVDATGDADAMGDDASGDGWKIPTVQATPVGDSVERSGVKSPCGHIYVGIAQRQEAAAVRGLSSAARSGGCRARGA